MLSPGLAAQELGDGFEPGALAGRYFTGRLLRQGETKRRNRAVPARQATDYSSDSADRFRTELAGAEARELGDRVRFADRSLQRLRTAGMPLGRWVASCVTPATPATWT